MGRAILTVWFTVVALLGPAGCCCVVAAGLTPGAPPGLPSSPAHPDRPSCCQHDAPAAPPDRSPELPPKPEPCPCQHHDQKQPAASPSPAAFDAQLRATGAVVVDWLPTPDTTRGPATSARDCGTLPPDARPAGRTLLAAYQILRC